jgi:hypothetical protein
MFIIGAVTSCGPVDIMKVRVNRLHFVCDMTREYRQQKKKGRCKNYARDQEQLLERCLGNLFYRKFEFLSE